MTANQTYEPERRQRLLFSLKHFCHLSH